MQGLCVMANWVDLSTIEDGIFRGLDDIYKVEEVAELSTAEDYALFKGRVRGGDGVHYSMVVLVNFMEHFARREAIEGPNKDLLGSTETLDFFGIKSVEVGISGEGVCDGVLSGG